MWFFVIIFLVVVLAVIGKVMSYNEYHQSRTDISIRIFLQSDEEDENILLDERNDPDNPIFAELQEELFDEYE